MENIYTFVAPLVICFLLLDLIFNFVFHKQSYEFRDFITNVMSATIAQTINVLLLYIVVNSYDWLSQFRFNSIEMNGWSYLWLLIAIDFLFYWFHRFGHSINILWAAHSPHHSSMHMNMSVALRSSLTQRLLSFSFFWPLVLLGFPVMDIYKMVGVQLMLGAWHHTSFIPRIKWFELIFNSPSLHRVHHGIQNKYLDKNFAEVFVLWDRMFGTFQAEEETPTYGMLNQPKSFRMSAINWHFYKVLVNASIKTEKWKDKILLWIMPLGLFPSDIPKRQLVLPSYDQLPKDNLSFNGKMRLLLLALLNTLILLPVINTQNQLDVITRVSGIILIWITATLAGRACDGIRRQKYLEMSKLLTQILYLILISNFVSIWVLSLLVILTLAENVLLFNGEIRDELINVV